MEPMDYTMDSDQQQHHHYHHQQQQQQLNAGRCPYYQSNPYNNYLPPTHRYDPVHNTDSWHQAGVSISPQNHPPYAPHPPHWGGNRSFTNAWHQFGGERIPNPPLPFHMPGTDWVQSRGFTGTFGYGGYSGNYSSSSAGNGNNGGTDTNNNLRSSAPVSSPSAAPVNVPSSTPSSMLHTEASSQLDRVSDNLSPSYDPVHAAAVRRIEELSTNRTTQADRAIRESYRNHLEEQRASQTRAARVYTRNFTAQDSAHARRNRRPSFGSSDEAEDDPDDFLDHYHQFFPHDENTIATLRGMAAGKRITSKNAIAAFEQVDLQELTEADRTCIICYNEFGVENPEGLIESPIRLPKCKHVFGDTCIRKWFEDSDSCPYCRDKLPSEPMYVRQRELLERLSRETQQTLRSSRYLGPRYPNNPDELTNGLRTTEGVGRNQDEHNYFLSQVHVDRRTSQNSPPRSSPSDSPESRRRRGRMGVNRALPPPRPTSVGSSRFNTSMSQQGFYRTGAFTSTAAANPNRTSYVPQRNVQSSARNVAPTPSTQEEASPPVAVGSSSDATEATRPREHHGAIAAVQGRLDEQQGDTPWAESFDHPSRASARLQINTTEVDTSNSSPRIPIQTRPNLSALSQHSSSGHSLPRMPVVSDTSNGDRYGSRSWGDVYPSSASLTPPQYPRWSS